MLCRKKIWKSILTSAKTTANNEPSLEHAAHFKVPLPCLAIECICHCFIFFCSKNINIFALNFICCSFVCYSLSNRIRCSLSIFPPFLYFFPLSLTHFCPMSFLYPLKTSENLWISDVFRGIVMWHWAKMG